MARIYFVGAGSPTPTRSRFGTAYVLQLGDAYLMFDCGPAATYKMVKMGLFPTQVCDLFFTHHHFDHNADYPCFLLCRWDQNTGREKALKIWGPSPTQKITERLFGPRGAFVDDWKARIEHPGSQDVFVKRGGVLPRPGPQYIVNEIESGEVVKTDQWTVTAAPTNHIAPWMASLAYRVDSPEGSVVFSGDTGICDTFTDLAQGADTLVMHCADHQHALTPALADMIGGTLDIAKTATQAATKRLVLSHQSVDLARPGSKEKAIADIAQHFDGEIIFAEEMMVLEF
jgi:ribonuclease BN (tRNA processing enzyme)